MTDRTTEQDRPLHILTVNVNGLKTNGDKLLEELKKKRSENNEVDVVFLTETHIGEKETDIDALENYVEDWKTSFTRYNSKSKGTAILVEKKQSFRCLDEIVDGFGRYVIVNCCISGTLCTFVSVYHHSKERGLLRELSKKIRPLDTDVLVVGGNFNTALDEKNDRTSKMYNSDHNKIRQDLQSFIKEHNLIDAWRNKHPDHNDYTYDYWRNSAMYKSRLAYFFINVDKRELVHDCSINNDKISDHRSVSLILHLKHQKEELKIFSCTVQDLPKDEDLAELRPDIILLTKGQAEDEDYIKKLKEEERKEKKWNVFWSKHSNAAFLVTEGQRDIKILFTVYHENYVILHCKVLNMPYTFVSAYRPTNSNLENMVRGLAHSESERKVIYGDFTPEGFNEPDFTELNGEPKESPYFIHNTLSGASKIKKQEISGCPYFSLILQLPEDEAAENGDDTISLSQ